MMKNNGRKGSFSNSNASMLDKIIQKWRFRKIFKYIKKNSVICDLGCGREGHFLFSAKDRIRVGVGLDIEVMEVFDDKINLKRANFDDHLPLDNSSFDFVVSLAVLEHLVQPRMFMCEAYRITRAGGVLLLTTPAPAAKPILELLSFMRLIDQAEIDDHKHYFTSKELKDIARESGFKDIAVKKFQFGFNNMLIAKK